MIRCVSEVVASPPGTRSLTVESRRISRDLGRWRGQAFRVKIGFHAAFGGQNSGEM